MFDELLLKRTVLVVFKSAASICLLASFSVQLAAGALKGDNREPWRRFFTGTTTNLVRDQAINADTGAVPNGDGGKEARKKNGNVKLPGLDKVLTRTPRIDSIGLLPIEPIRKSEPGIAWGNVIRQSFLFLAVEHGFRFATEGATRADLKGPFFGDWLQSVRNLRGWRDGDPFLVNYIGHPMQGAVAGYILIQNDPKGAKRQIIDGRDYWRSRFKAFGWNMAYSVQFEIGPLSESSLGNVGLRPVQTSRHPQAWVDLVVTPTLGSAWLVGEDALDYYLIRRLERRISSPAGRMFVRSFFNPGRSFANIMRGQWLWHRDNRPGVTHY